jgi:hypothetical protein
MVSELGASVLFLSNFSTCDDLSYIEPCEQSQSTRYDIENNIGKRALGKV